MAKETQTLPAVIPSGYGEVSVVTREESRTPYIAFVYAKTEKYGDYKQKIPDLREGEPVFVPPAPGVPKVLRPLRYFLLSATQFWAEYNADGLMLQSSAEEKKYPFTETIEALILVFIDGQLFPAQVRFKGTTCPGVTKSVSTLAEAKTAGWAKKGEDFAFTAQIPQPWGRFVTSASRIEKPRRDEEKRKKLGERYPTLEAVCNPTTAAELKALVGFFQDKERLAVLEEVKSVYHKRLIDAKSKEQKAA